MMINILKKTFAETINKYNHMYIGNTCYIILDNNRRIEMYISTTLDAMKLNLLHKENGNIHHRVIKFVDVFSDNSKRIINGNGYTWCVTPTDGELSELNRTVENYIELWR